MIKKSIKARSEAMKSSLKSLSFHGTTWWFLFLLVITCLKVEFCYGQDYDDNPKPSPPPPDLSNCNGIYLTYSLMSREKEYPHVKNVSAQSWAFKSEASIINLSQEDLRAWKMFIGFHHREILVSVSNAVIIDGSDFPADVSNGTTLAGNPMTDLLTSIETAGDFDQIRVRMEIKGTQFGLGEKASPMPKTIRLENDGFKCPTPRIQGGNNMHVCCLKDPKAKAKMAKASKFFPRTYGDLTFTYDILQAYKDNYQAQVTIDNNHPLGRLDHWNLTWEWMNGEFIHSMRGAYTHKIDASECIYGPAGKYYQDFDFSEVMNCEKHPIIADLPAERANDTKVGKVPYCCRNGTVLPSTMDPTQSRSIFQMKVFKLPPFLNRTSLVPPQKWKVTGVLNPDYKCGPPVRVDPTQFPDSSGLQATTSAVASWQINCNITGPKPNQARCCVSFSAFYNESVIPCDTCACGCQETDTCSPNAHAMLLPPEAILVPFGNRTEKAKAWAKIKHFPVPKKLPCPDNCGVSIHWHVNTDYKTGWTARITLFNWEGNSFEDWFGAIKMDKAAKGYENVYSFNGTKLDDNFKDIIFFQGVKGLNFLMAETNGTHSYDPRVPGKQQSVISFKKKGLGEFNIRRDGFPTKVYFNGEECALPSSTPVKSAGYYKAQTSVWGIVFIGIITTLLLKDQF